MQRETDRGPILGNPCCITALRWWTEGKQRKEHRLPASVVKSFLYSSINVV
jgi:hypothetical protein